MLYCPKRKALVYNKRKVQEEWDFTSCTILTTDKNNKPLCSTEKFKNEPHAYVKLWKHHGAQQQADRIA